MGVFYSPSVRQIHQALSCQSCVYLGGLQTVPAPGCIYAKRSTSIHHSKSPPLSPTGDVKNHLVSEVER